MKTMFRILILSIAALAVASCAPPANTNTTTNTNANANTAAKPAAPTADSLMALDQKAWEAYKNKDKTDGSVGGGYTPASGAIGMTGWPDNAAQQFGSALSKTKNGKPVSELPGKIDPDCQPANEKKVDFLAFAAAHEVGHGVDDAKAFMARNLSKAAFGSWVEHGAKPQSSTCEASDRPLSIRIAVSSSLGCMSPSAIRLPRLAPPGPPWLRLVPRPKPSRLAKPDR